MKFVSIFGYGSLMNQNSAMNTMPSLINFKKAILHGYRREYSLVSISGLKKGEKDPYIAALAITQSVNDEIVVGCVFDIPENELQPYFEREARYKPIQVEVDVYNMSDLSPKTVQAWTVIEQTDEDYKSKLLIQGKSYYDEVGIIYPEGKLWGRKDILPMASYFQLVINAAIHLDHLYNIEVDIDNLQDNSNNRSCVKNLLCQGYLANKSTNLLNYMMKYEQHFSKL